MRRLLSSIDLTSALVATACSDSSDNSESPKSEQQTESAGKDSQSVVGT
ncbi:hypothetical protein NLL38_10795 [Corynebacterium accolens]|nr:hypothetical protein [Corynebacterium accolens]WKS68771.1 hypothetical protein NLL40_10395 [Corynebacterium accolens]WKS71135.1 hypothetical protein NLL38_10795 [Corynebacterium accolens]WKS73353.1 hypothetical protein NLL44_10550 [Corynebacterium accolens]